MTICCYKKINYPFFKKKLNDNLFNNTKEYSNSSREINFTKLKNALINNRNFQHSHLAPSPLLCEFYKWEQHQIKV